MSFLPILLIFVVLILVMYIPQRRQQKKTRQMLDSMKRGDRVQTIGGIYGTIVDLNDEVVTIMVGPDRVRLVFRKSAIGVVDSVGAPKTDPYHASGKSEPEEESPVEEIEETTEQIESKTEDAAADDKSDELPH